MVAGCPSGNSEVAHVAQMQFDARQPAVAIERGGDVVMRQDVMGEGQHAGEGQPQVAQRLGGAGVAGGCGRGG